MKHSSFVRILILSCLSSPLFGFFGRTQIIPRSETVNAAREIAVSYTHLTLPTILRV